MTLLRRQALSDMIPRWTYVLTAAVWAAIQLAVHWGFTRESNPPHPAFQLLFGLYMATMLSPLVLLAGIVNTDSKQRGMRAPFWTALALFPPGVGAALYFLFRVPKPVVCARCGMRVRLGSAYCSTCGDALGARCPQCHHDVVAGDSYCVSCGGALETP